MQANLTLREAVKIMRSTKDEAQALFPDKGDVFDLIYAPRLKMIIWERFLVLGGLAGK